MVSRTLVPLDARIPPESGTVARNTAPIARASLLNCARVIPADARIIGNAEEQRPDGDSVQRPFMVPKLLIPTNARIGALASPDPKLLWEKGVFDEALLDKPPIGHRRRPAEWLLSLAVHAIVTAIVLIVPLFYTQALDLNQFRVTFLVAPPVPSAPPPPPPVGITSEEMRRTVSPKPAKLTMPMAIPRTVTVPRTVSPSDLLGGIPGGEIGGVPGGQVGGVIGGLAGGVIGGMGPAAPPPPPAATPERTAPTGPLRVGGEVKEPRPIFTPQPEYPLLAKQARLQGVVEIDAILDEQGNVVQTKAVSGPALLIPAALKAVSTWKYEPTYLNGEPYPIAMTIHVSFLLK